MPNSSFGLYKSLVGLRLRSLETARFKMEEKPILLINTCMTDKNGACTLATAVLFGKGAIELFFKVPIRALTTQSSTF